MEDHIYIAIDLKSFYASVECVERGLDPLTANLVVADTSRTEKTICLAVSPALKAYGISGRARLFEVVQRVAEINALRRAKAPNRTFRGKASNSILLQDPSLELDYIAAPPQMSHYMDISAKIISIYMKYIAPQDIHVYSIDEVFMDVTKYLPRFGMTAHELAMTMIREVLASTGITATAGIGTNLYLCKVAMDIVAKHIPADRDGVRIAELDERSYREQLWEHRPLTDFWRVGRGTARKLEKHGMHTMGDVARCSAGKPEEYFNEDLLYRLFGINAELLIDHAWGWEPTAIADIKSYVPETNSLSSGQVLSCPYDAEKARIIVREMTDLLALDLVEKRLVTDQIGLSLGYDTENLTDPERRRAYHGPVVTDYYGRAVPKYAHGSYNLPAPTSSSRELTDAALALFDRIADPNLLIRRVTIAANRAVREDLPTGTETEGQLTLFDGEDNRAAERAKERGLQETVLELRRRFGKNVILKGTSLQEGATTIQRNGQIGGHKA